MPTQSARAMPAEGVFENCPLETAFPVCASRLAVMKAGGVQVVLMSAFGASLGALSHYAATAQNLGMSVMWEIGDSNWWQQPPTTNLATDVPQFAAACGCSQNQALLTYVVDWLRALPGTYGYYAADDSALRPGDETAIAAYMALIKQRDPNHPAMIGAFSEQQRDGYQSIAGLIGQEVYPVTTDPVLPLDAHPATWDRVSKIATATQSSADRAGTASAFILQAFTWGDNLGDGEAVGVCSPSDTIDSCNARLRYPSGAEQLALRNAILRNATLRSSSGTRSPARTVRQSLTQAAVTPAEPKRRRAGTVCRQLSRLTSPAMAHRRGRAASPGIQDGVAAGLPRTRGGIVRFRPSTGSILPPYAHGPRFVATGYVADPGPAVRHRCRARSAPRLLRAAQSRKPPSSRRQARLPRRTLSMCRCTSALNVGSDNTPRRRMSPTSNASRAAFGWPWRSPCHPGHGPHCPAGAAATGVSTKTDLSRRAETENELAC
jgi:hypothetical protein